MSPDLARETMSRVLLVDDSPMIRNMLVACLRERPGMTFIHARSGLEAVEQLSLTRFDLIVLDLHMPDMSGYEVLSFVRRQDELRRLPILVLTTDGDDATRVRAIEAGASSFMTKPFTASSIREAADALLDAV